MRRSPITTVNLRALPLWLGAAFITLHAGTAFGQATAPSSITPPTLRPPPDPTTPAPELPQVQGLTPPAGAAGLTVRLAGLDVEGALPELAPEVAAIAAQFVDRTVSLAQIYAAASAIEAAHIRRGYVLVRVAVPPQELNPGGKARLVVVDGFIERIDTASVPKRVRAPIAARVAILEGKRGLKLSQIEPPLVLAGAVPGVAITSTLARGETPGGTQLLLGATYSPISGSVTADNGFSPALGRFGVTAQISLNSIFGRGEQIYGFAVSGYDVLRAFESDAPVRVLGGGAVFTTDDGRAFLNPEVTFSRTQPRAQPGVPLTRGKLRRLSLRTGYTIDRTRRATLTIGGTVENVIESNDAYEFDTLLSLDRFTVGRLQVNYSGSFLRGGGYAFGAQASQGFGGIDNRDASPFSDVTPSSRQGAGPFFRKLTANFRAVKATPGRVELGLFVKGQWSLGKPLFRSEQSALEGADALSGYIGGITAVDSSLTGRIELTRSFAAPGLSFLRLSPYVFGAGGRGWISGATAIEDPTLTLLNVGAGVRGGLGRTGIGFAVEYAHGFSPNPRFDAANRVSASTSVFF